MLPLFNLSSADLEIVYGVVILLGVALSRFGAGALQLTRRPGAQDDNPDMEVGDAA
jgi:hypothetical protein